MTWPAPDRRLRVYPPAGVERHPGRGDLRLVRDRDLNRANDLMFFPENFWASTTTTTSAPGADEAFPDELLRSFVRPLELHVRHPRLSAFLRGFIIGAAAMTAAVAAVTLWL